MVRSDAMQSQAIRHRSVSANGITFHVAEAGPGPGVGAGPEAGTPSPAAPLVLCLHGFPESWYSWRHQLEHLGGRGVHVVAPDLRGYGGSDKPQTGYDLDTLAADVAALIPALGHERATVVGHDWGGACAWHAAYRHPERVERLAILNCPPAEVLLAGVLTRPRQLLRSWYFLFFQLPLIPEYRLTKDRAAVVARMFKAGAGRRGVFTDADLEHYREGLLRPGAARAALAYYREAFRSVGQARAAAASGKRLAMPGLILWGARDAFLTVELTYGLAQRFAEPCTVRYLPGVGHWTQQEAPDEVNRALADFVGCGVGCG